MDIRAYLKTKRSHIEQALEEYMLPANGILANHIESLRYSLFAGGKYVRPILCLAAAESIDGYNHSVLPVACALECIHTYSLIHDDLPSMDNDDLRRGKPTNHKMFGEAEAILAGDGLLTFAFDLLSNSQLYEKDFDQKRLQVIHIIAKASGSLGMVGGQSMDIASEGKDVSFETLRTIHSCKTGALITASVRAGAVMGGASASQLEALTQYGNSVGLAFQIVDDLLNAIGTVEELGKAAGSDIERQKATYPAFFGIDGTRKKAKDAIDKAVDALSDFDQHADPLRELAQYVYTRTH